MKKKQLKEAYTSQVKQSEQLSIIVQNLSEDNVRLKESLHDKSYDSDKVEQTLKNLQFERKHANLEVDAIKDDIRQALEILNRWKVKASYVFIFMFLLFSCNTTRHMNKIHPYGGYWTGKRYVIFDSTKSLGSWNTQQLGKTE